jgi:hypothetical protein
MSQGVLSPEPNNDPDEAKAEALAPDREKHGPGFTYLLRADALDDDLQVEEDEESGL